MSYTTAGTLMQLYTNPGAYPYYNNALWTPYYYNPLWGPYGLSTYPLLYPYARWPVRRFRRHRRYFL